MNKRSSTRWGPSSCTRAALKKRKNDEEGICQSPNIPDELIFLILVRFSIKCLLRLKSVCKYWFKLISSPDFIKFYLQNASDDPDYSCHRLLYMIRSNRYSIKFQNAHLYPTLCKPYLHDKFQVDMSCPMKFLPRESLEFVGSCNGLVCLTSSKNKVLIWNPTLRKCMRLPNYGSTSSTFYGFGYDELSDDYKVVAICNTRAKVYSSRTRCWKKLADNIGELSQVDRNGCFLNGKLHWATEKNIFTVDLSSELRGFMELPKCVQDCTDWKIHVAGAYLVAFCYYRKTHVDMWMMMRYGEKESWDKANKKYPFDGLNDLRRCLRHIPCFLSSDGEMLLHRLYVPPSDSVRKLADPTWRLLPMQSSSTSLRMTKCDMSAFFMYNHEEDFYTYNNPRVHYAKLPLPNMPVIVYVESLVWPFP